MTRTRLSAMLRIPMSSLPRYIFQFFQNVLIFKRHVQIFHFFPFCWVSTMLSVRHFPGICCQIPPGLRGQFSQKNSGDGEKIRPQTDTPEISTFIQNSGLPGFTSF